MAQAQAVTTESTITRAVVYSADRAQVFRRCEISLPPGDHTVHVQGLWAAADRDSLQVGMKKGGARTTMRAVQFTSVESVTDVRPQVAELETKIETARADVKRFAEDIGLCDSAIAAYAAVRAKIVSANASLAQGVPVPTAYDPQKWQAIAAFVAKGTAEQRAKQEKLRGEKAKADKLLAGLERELRDLGSNHVRRTSVDVAELLVTIAADGAATDPVDLVLELSYLVSGASWTPAYDIRIDRKTKSMQLAYNANVRNRTGEDWKEVRLELSTAAATNAGSMPALRQWVLREATPAYMMNQMQECEQVVMRSMPMMQQMHVTNMIPAASAAPPPPRPRDFSAPTAPAATVKAQGGSSTFAVAALATVKSDNQPVKVAVAVLDLPVHFRYSAVPKLDPNVYLKVRAVNTSDFDLLAGKANVFSDNQLVSTTSLDKVASGEDFWTFLGQDDDITIKRVQAPHHTLSTTGGFLSAKKKVRAFTYHYTAKNLKSSEEELVIWDQYPIPSDKRITVDATMPKAEQQQTPCELRPVGGGKAAPVRGNLVHKINDDRFIEWFAQMTPGHEVKFDFSFNVEYPDELRISL